MSFSVFGKNSLLLPAFCPPYPNEALSSWLTRLAFDNGLSRSSLLINANLDIPMSKTALNIDRLTELEKLDKLSEFTNCPPAIIRNTTLHAYENKLFTRLPSGAIPSNWVAKKPIGDGNGIWSKRSTNDRKDNLLYCPSCLSDRSQPVYYRKSWRLSVSFVCPDCNCYLRESCPHCGEGCSNMSNIYKIADYDSLDEYLLNCESCKKDISECMAEPAPCYIIQMQKQLNEYLDHPYQATERYSVGYFKVIYGLANLLSGWQNNVYIRSFNADIYHQTNVPDFRYESYRQSICALTLKQRADVFSMACWLLDEWPSRFIGLCSRHLLTSQYILRYIADAPKWFLRELEHIATFGAIPKTANHKGYFTFEHDKVHTAPSRQSSDYDYDAQEAYYNGKTYRLAEDEDDEEEYRDLYEMLFETINDTAYVEME